jgi:hypothetical protein
MDPRHIDFLRRNGLNTYNCYFNRDKKRTVYELPIEWIGPIPPPRIHSEGPSVDGAFLNEYRHVYDPFLYEYRDGDIAVPSPPETVKTLEEPSSSDYKKVPLEYIREHGVMEFLLESGYPYSLECLFHYRKPCEYQKEYLRKLIGEGRLTRKVFRL